MSKFIRECIKLSDNQFVYKIADRLSLLVEKI